MKRDDLIYAANKAVTKELRAGTWWRLDGYRLMTDPRAPEGDRARFVGAPKSAWRRRQLEDEYRPLVDRPYLFLRFAELADDGGLDYELDTDKNARKALAWADKYGVLGLTPAKGVGAWWGDPRGGLEDTVAKFAFEALTANRLRRLYEAAHRSSGVDVETIAGIAKEVQRHRYRGLITGSPGAARDWALNWAGTNIQGRVALYAYPQLYQRGNRTFVEGYDFANLYGALWLQALWLLTAGPDNVTKCDYPECNKIIAYKQPEPLPSDAPKGARKKYKTRKDKRFCDNTCVQGNRRMNQRLGRAG